MIGAIAAGGYALTFGALCVVGVYLIDPGKDTDR